MGGQIQIYIVYLCIVQGPLCSMHIYYAVSLQCSGLESRWVPLKSRWGSSARQASPVPPLLLRVLYSQTPPVQHILYLCFDCIHMYSVCITLGARIGVGQAQSDIVLCLHAPSNKGHGASLTLSWTKVALCIYEFCSATKWPCEFCDTHTLCCDDRHLWPLSSTLLTPFTISRPTISHRGSHQPRKTSSSALHDAAAACCNISSSA